MWCINLKLCPTTVGRSGYIPIQLSWSPDSSCCAHGTTADYAPACYHRVVALDRTSINTLRPRQNGCHVTTFSNRLHWMKRVIFKSKFLWSFVPDGPIINNAALVQIMAWRRSNYMLLSVPVVAQYIGVYMLYSAWINQTIIPFHFLSLLK